MSIKVTFIIPTFNSEKYLNKCLASIAKQTFPKKHYEVIIADGGSTDRTVQIIDSYQKKLPIVLLDNKKIDAESGKTLGIASSKGEIIVLLDSDNEIVDEKWLTVAVAIFEKHPQVWGVESPWFLNPEDSKVNQYFSLLQFCDPVARLFAPDKPPTTPYKNYELITVAKDQTPVTGANGFFWRKKVMDYKINESNKFEETNYVSFLVSHGHNTYARLTTKGIYHYYCDSVRKYIKKRTKIANKFLDRKDSKQQTWVDKVGPTKLLLSAAYNGTVIGPTIQALIMMIKDKNTAWKYHPLISFLTVAIYGYYFIKRTLFAHTSSK